VEITGGSTCSGNFSPSGPELFSATPGSAQPIYRQSGQTYDASAHNSSERNRFNERGDALQLEVKAELSNFANPEQEGSRSMPLLRQLRINASTVASPGKPIVMGVVDDPNSKRQFELEVTVTKIR
jgi:hypothetical protein